MLIMKRENRSEGVVCSSTDKSNRRKPISHPPSTTLPHSQPLLRCVNSMSLRLCLILVRLLSFLPFDIRSVDSRKARFLRPVRPAHVLGCRLGTLSDPAFNAPIDSVCTDILKTFSTIAGGVAWWLFL